MTNTGNADGRGAATLAASLLLAAAAGCGGSPDPAAGSQAVVASQSGPASGIDRDDGERRTPAGSIGAEAIGGTGMSTSAPPAPALRLALVGAQLRLSWDASGAAAYYKLFANTDGASGFTRVGGDLPADRTGIALEIVAHRHDWDSARYLLEACNGAGCTASNAVTTFGMRPRATNLAHGVRARFARPATASGTAAVEASNTGASARFVRSTSAPALTAPSLGSAGATPESVRPCARCLAQ